MTPAPHPIDRAEAFRTLDPGSDRDIETLIRGLDDPEPLVRGVAVARLIQCAPDRVLSALGGRPRPGASDERVLLEIELLRGVGAGRTPPGYVGAACRWAEELTTPELRARAAEVCLGAGNPAPALVDRLARDAHWAVRTRVALTLDSKTDPATRAVLDRLASDPHPTVRSAARSRARRSSAGAGERRTEW